MLNYMVLIFKGGNFFFNFFHLNDLFAQYRIERPSVITGGLLILVTSKKRRRITFNHTYQQFVGSHVTDAVGASDGSVKRIEFTSLIDEMVNNFLLLDNLLFIVHFVIISARLHYYNISSIHVYLRFILLV